ncbi:YybS family protein [Domibacillus robiginosus]|uniref:YybS family protein n=1 Tax=Domibacillus robiginosus TaxID=1071054 RepID=UPI00155A518E|nr:YybS family protein [Domibacillus robiginosus]
MEKTRIITEGAMMLAIFAILLAVSIYVPIVSIIGALFLLLPFLVYSSKYPPGPAFSLLAVSLLLAFLVGGIVSVPVAIMYGTTGLIMGTLIRRQSDGWIVYMGGSIAFLLNMIVQYAAAVWLFDISFADEFSSTFKQSVAETSRMLGQEAPYTGEEINTLISYITAILPAIFVVVAFVTVLLLRTANYPIAKRLGVKVKPLQPFRTVRLPRTILWYYLLFMVGAIFVKPAPGTSWYDIYVNMMFILQACLYIQGLSFVFFYAHSKRWPKAIPVLAALLSIPLIPLLYLIRLLGIIDLGFDLRQRMQKKP